MRVAASDAAQPNAAAQIQLIWVKLVRNCHASFQGLQWTVMTTHRPCADQ
jgi:hypothetical protein